MNQTRLPSTRWAVLTLFLVLLVGAGPAQAQRGQPRGERKTEEKEERRTPPPRAPETRPQPAPRPDPAPAPRAEPQPAPRPAPRAEPPAPAPEAPRTPPTRTDRTDRGRQPATPRPEAETRPPRSPDRGRTGSPETGRTPQTQRDDNRTPGRGRTPSTQPQTGSRQGRVIGGGHSGRVVTRPSYGSRDHYKWYRVPPVPAWGYHYRPAAPIVLHIDYEWPWEYRYRRAWSPRYQYRQTVRLESDYGRQRWDTRLEIVTTYRQRVRSAGRNRAELDFDIEAVEIYQNGRYLGRVSRIPDRFGRVRGTVRRNGSLSFDRDVLVVGSRESGFELIATRPYDGYFLSQWRRDDPLDVARLDLRRNRVEAVRHSRLLDYDGYGGYAPISLLPDDERWLGDYGPYAVSTFAYDDDFYDGYGYDDSYYYGTEGNAYAPDARRASPTLSGQSDDTYETPGGARIRLQREAQITRLE